MGSVELSVEQSKLFTNTDASEEEFGIVAKGVVLHHGTKVQD